MSGETRSESSRCGVGRRTLAGWPLARALPALVLAATASLASAQRPVRVPARVVRVYVRNERVRFDRVQPLNVGRRILVPLRGVFEKMGARVGYDARRRRVTATRGGTRVVLPLSGRTAYVNGEPRRLDAFPKISKGHVLVPIRFIAETLDATVAYRAKEYTVRITPH